MEENKKKSMKIKYNMDKAKKDIGVYLEVLENAWVYLIATFINFCTTLIVFPAVCTLVEPQNPVRYV